MKKNITKLFYFLLGMALFAQSAEYSAYLAKAKEYESQKKWCHALESYYDALGTDDEPELKQEANNCFTELRDAILSGNPGFGKFNAFTLHDEWKNLLIDAEQVGSSFNKYTLTVGDLVQGNLDYATQTATYTSKISYKDSDRYENTIRIVENGYKVAYKGDWSSDLPREWPDYSVSSKKDGTYNVSGALVYEKKNAYTNAFESNLFDYKFNIVDENGNELVKGVRWLLGHEDSRIAFSGISPDVMDLIDNGKAFVNPVACYLEYGKYNYADDKGGRTFIKNFPEVQLPMEKSVFICWNNKTDRKKENIKKYDLYLIGKKVDNFTFANIPEKNYKVLTTEVTQELYKIVMEENPSYFFGRDRPVENVSWYDAIYFCNRLSEIKGKKPVYAVDGETDVKKWGYTPHEGNLIRGEITQNTSASGFRLPTLAEWQYAARGGENYRYAGSDNLDEVGWYGDNSGDKTHAVAQKKPNGYGLYDMSGNVWEWVWDSYDDNNRCSCGGCYYYYDGYCEVVNGNYYYADDRYNYIGFRLVCPSFILRDNEL